MKGGALVACIFKNVKFILEQIVSFDSVHLHQEMSGAGGEQHQQWPAADHGGSVSVRLDAGSTVIDLESHHLSGDPGIISL